VNWNLRDWRREGEKGRGVKASGEGGRFQVVRDSLLSPTSQFRSNPESGERRRKEADHRQQHPAAAATALVSPLVCTSRSDNGGEY